MLPGVPDAPGPAHDDLAAPVHRVDMDHGTWSSRRGKPRAYPPFCMDAGLMTITALKTQIWTFGAPVAGASNSRSGTLVSHCCQSAGSGRGAR